MTTIHRFDCNNIAMMVKKCPNLVFFSDVVVQIVDARNPLLFRCEDLVSVCVCSC